MNSKLSSLHGSVGHQRPLVDRPAVDDQLDRHGSRIADAGPLDVPIRLLIEPEPADLFVRLLVEQGGGLHGRFQPLARSGCQHAGSAAVAGLADAQARDLEIEQMAMPVAAIAAAVAQAIGPGVVSRAAGH